MSVKMFLMWNSELLIDGGGDINVGTSLLEASNLLVLRVLSAALIQVFWYAEYIRLTRNICCSSLS